MTTIKKKRMLFGGFLSAAAFVILASCGNDTGSSKDETASLTTDTAKTAGTGTNVDTTNAAGNGNAADTSTTAVATGAGKAKSMAKKKKGMASAVFNSNSSDNTMKVEKDKEGVYNKAEKMPEYPGGQPALSKFIEKNINYPQNAIDDDREGTVDVSFVVDEKGRVMNPSVAGKSAGHGLDEEAVKVVKQMPAWKPGMVKGKAVRTRLTLPVTFKLADA